MLKKLIKLKYLVSQYFPHSQTLITLIPKKSISRETTNDKTMKQ